MKEHHGVDLKLAEILRYRWIKELKDQGMASKEIVRLMRDVNKREAWAQRKRHERRETNQ